MSKEVIWSLIAELLYICHSTENHAEVQLPVIIMTVIAYLMDCA